MINAKFNFTDINKNLNKIIHEAERKALMRCGAIVEGNAKKILSTSGWGRNDEKPKKIIKKIVRSQDGKTRTTKHIGVDYSPSEPYDPPHLMTGNLRRSITHAFDSFKKIVLCGPGGNWAFYGKFLESGTKDGKIKPRPFMRPSLDKSKEKIKEQFRGMLNG